MEIMNVTNKEKAEQIAWNLFDEGLFFHNHESQKQEIQSAILKIAEWKDEFHKKEIADLQRKLNAEKDLRKQIEKSVRGLPQPIKELIKAMNMVI